MKLEVKLNEKALARNAKNQSNYRIFVINCCRHKPTGKGGYVCK